MAGANQTFQLTNVAYAVQGAVPLVYFIRLHATPVVWSFVSGGKSSTYQHSLWRKEVASNRVGAPDYPSSDAWGEIYVYLCTPYIARFFGRL